MDNYDQPAAADSAYDSPAPADSAPAANTTATDGWGAAAAPRASAEPDAAPAVGRYEPPQRRASRSPFPDRRGDDYVPPRRERSPPPKPAAYRDQVIPRSEVLGVFGLSIRTDERALHDEFSRYGRVQKVVIVYDARSDRSRGFGFITMGSEDEAEECIKQLNGLDLNGRKIRVDYSMTVKPHQPTPGEYRGEKRPDFDDRRPGFDRDFRPPPPRDYGRDRDYRGGGDRYGGGDRDRYGGGGGGGYDRGRDSRDYRPPPPPRDYGRDRDYRDSRDAPRGGGAYDDFGRTRRDDDRPNPSSYRSRSPAPRGGDAYGADRGSSSRRSPSPARRRYSPAPRDGDDRREGGGRGRDELDAPPRSADEGGVAVRW